MQRRETALAPTGDREALARVVREDRHELSRAIEELKQVVKKRLDLGAHAERKRWTWLPTAIGIGLFFARRRSGTLRLPPPATSHERTSSMSTFNKIVRNLSNRLGEVTVGDVLYAAGLERRQSLGTRIATGIGLFGTGLLVGAGLGLVFAPRTGRELRHEIAERAREIRDKGMSAMRKQGNGVHHDEEQDIGTTDPQL